MQLLRKDNKLKIHNGDPRKWPLGIYRSQVNPDRIVMVVGSVIGSGERTAIAVTSTGSHSLTSIQSDGYLLLPSGERITIEA